ncbi:MAG: energy transducer TonB [Gemmatimonadales bacterium]
MSRRVFLIALIAASPAAQRVAAQSRSEQLVTVARERISARDYQGADSALTQALGSALYMMDSVRAFVWRGILEHLRGNDSLTRLNFRRVIVEHHITTAKGLDDNAPGLADIFESEARPFRVYPDSELDQRAVWRSGPPIAYPPDLRRRRVGGHAIVRAIIDTLGRAQERELLVLETPDPAFEAPLMQMMLAARFTPAQRKGHAVRSEVTLGFDLSPPPPESPTRLVTAAREQLRTRRVDSALTLTGLALDSVNQPSAAEQVYALLVQGQALQLKHRDSLATISFDAALEGYRDLTARGVDLAPFLKRLADSIRISRRGIQQRPAPFAAPSAVGAVDEQPALISHPPIRYAAEMQALRIGGTVIVEATLDTVGRVLPTTVRIVQSPNPVFDAEAKRVVVAALYRPARIRGRAARVTIRQPITFAAY